MTEMLMRMMASVRMSTPTRVDEHVDQQDDEDNGYENGAIAITIMMSYGRKKAIDVNVKVDEDALAWTLVMISCGQ